MNILDQTGLLDCKAECKIYMYMLRADMNEPFACSQRLRMLARGVLVQHCRGIPPVLVGFLNRRGFPPALVGFLSPSLVGALWARDYWGGRGGHTAGS